MPSPSQLIATTILLGPTSTCLAFNTPKPSYTSLSFSNNNNNNPRISTSSSSLLTSCYLPPYGTVVRSSIIVSARDGDYNNYRDDYDASFQEGGNYWSNPVAGIDRYPNNNDNNSRRRRRRERGERSYNGFVKDDTVTVSGGRAGMPRRVDADWWETRRVNDDEYDYDDEMLDDEDGYYYDEEEEEEYGLPPPGRSRSSFRTGPPPPPRPIRDFYNKLFWFGFDPSTTRSTDRTMFGGTRGKFNAMSLLHDREVRQEQNRRRSLRGRQSYDPAIQNFGDVREWNERKMGTSPAGGNGVGDDAVVEQIEEMSDMRAAVAAGVLPPGGEGIPPVMDVEFDPILLEEEAEERYFEEEDGMPTRRSPRMDRRRSSSRRDYYLDDDDDMDDFDFELERKPRRSDRRRNRGRSDDRESRRRGWFSLPESKREQAEAYDRYLGLGPPPRERYDDDYDSPRSRRRSGFAYKYDRDLDDDEDDDFYYDIDDDIIDVRPKRSSTRRRSWEERAMEMDRIPPRSVAAWGPEGRVDRDAQTLAALKAEREIEKARKYVEKKEDMVDDAKREVISLKADASFYEQRLDQGRETKETQLELGYILRDVEDASRILRMAKAERDAAIKRLDRLKSKHWALLSEYDATRSFDLD